MKAAESAKNILDLVIPDLEDAGYEVYRNPPSQLLPAFMGDYTPDAIAIGGPKNLAMRNLAIEIVREDRPSAVTDRRLIERFTGAPDWDLRIYYARSGEPRAAIERVSRDIIAAKVEGVENLLAAGETGAALLIGWSILEAIGRNLVPERLAHAQSSGRLIAFLAGQGILTPDEADQMRRLADLRNRVAHGGLETPVTAAEVKAFLVTLKLVLQENPAGNPTPPQH